jgi:hypothetical protein
MKTVQIVPDQFMMIINNNFHITNKRQKSINNKLNKIIHI